MTFCFIDHITVTAPNLEAGAQFVRESLGVAPQTGGGTPSNGNTQSITSSWKLYFDQSVAGTIRSAKYGVF